MRNRPPSRTIEDESVAPSVRLPGRTGACCAQYGAWSSRASDPGPIAAHPVVPGGLPPPPPPPPAAPPPAVPPPAAAAPEASVPPSQPAAAAPPPAAPTAPAGPPAGAQVAAAITGVATTLKERLSGPELLLGGGALLIA